MFANRKLNPALEKHIYSFIVEGNLDLIYPIIRRFDDSLKRASTLTLIRKVCKGSKEVTQSWQDKFAELCVLLYRYELSVMSSRPLNRNVIEFEFEEKGLGLKYRVIGLDNQEKKV